LAHGLGEHIGRYGHVAAAFNAAGLVLFAADLRGHGRSGGARGHAPSLEAYLKDLDALIEQARERFPGLPIFLYGHSLGAILLLNYVLRRKPDVAGVIATSPALHSNLEAQPVKVLLARVLGTLLPSFTMEAGLDATKISHDPAVVQAYRADPLVHDHVTLGWGKMMLGINRWALEHAAEFSLPLLLMAGKEDVIAYPSSSIEFAAGLGDRCRLVLWDGMLHELHNEPRQAEVLKTMTDWLDGQLRASPS
jgi:alpha-beta hydrolase superfamily lysophospholipase